jgi:GTP cyclohydrolase II
MTRLTGALLDDEGQTSVERAISELRSARPIVLRDGSTRLLMIGVEALDRERATRLDLVGQGQAGLVLPAARLRRLGLERKEPGLIALPQIDLDRIEKLALRVDGRLDAPVTQIGALQTSALDLAALALLLPALVVMPVSDAATQGVQEVDMAAVVAYRQARISSMRIISRAPVPLENAQTEFVIFRGGEGLRDQVAIIVGAPDLRETVPVRLHSACLTGDLFGSLKCDCGDQLRGTVRWMAENGGGILLYLDQEGRGNGLANKIRAYKLQSEGYDTYEADEVIGFDLDQRRFEFAAAMLGQLGVTRVKLLTNNPEKIAAVRRSGIDVVSHERVIGRPTAENVLYLTSKRDRAGHLIDVEAMQSRLLHQD